MSGGGGGKRWDFHYWVRRLPPEGNLTLACEWPARGMSLTKHELDRFAARASRAQNYGQIVEPAVDSTRRTYREALARSLRTAIRESLWIVGRTSVAQLLQA
jgi:hypothetical protein